MFLRRSFEKRDVEKLEDTGSDEEVVGLFSSFRLNEEQFFNKISYFFLHVASHN